MKSPLSLVALLSLASVVSAQQQDKERLYSAPRLLSADVLDRLNMKLAWSGFAPVENLKDGILSVQMAPVRVEGKPRMRLLVQTRSGIVLEMDGETGQTLWRVRVGNPDTATHGVGFNSSDVVAVRGTDVYGIRRKDGNIRWKMSVRAVPSTTPLMDNVRLYLCVNTDRVESYDLPVEGEGKPVLFRTHRTVRPFQLEPKQSEAFLFYPSPRGSVAALQKNNMGLFLRFETGALLSAGPGVHEAEAGLYIGGRDSNVYGYSLIEGEPNWRFTVGSPVERAPFVNDDDVYATANEKGLFRLYRRTLSAKNLLTLLERKGLATRAQIEEVVGELKNRAGDPASIITALLQKGYMTEEQKLKLRWRGGEAVWNNPEGDRVLAVNPKFVYAKDRAGRLLVIERAAPGRTLSRYDVCDYPVPISNELTDRVYLAAHNGLIICLHDREYITPVSMKTLPQPAAPPPPGGGGAPPAPGMIPQRP